MLAIASVGISCLDYRHGHYCSNGNSIPGLRHGQRSGRSSYLIAHYFGRKHFAGLYGLNWTAYAVADATGPPVVVRFYDRLGMYQPRLIFALALTCVAGATLSLLLPRYPAESDGVLEDLAREAQIAS